jgi:hypothetical protein
MGFGRAVAVHIDSSEPTQQLHRLPQQLLVKEESY